MKNYDAIIIGGGGGLKLRPVADMGSKVAIIEKEDLGGTCLNRGCIPSKMLIHPADLAQEIREAHKFSIKNDPNFTVDFEALVTRVTATVTKSSKSIEVNYKKHENIDFYSAHARFISDKIIEVNGEQLTADKIFIATGSRPTIPAIEGLLGTPYMTSREALRNTKLPKKMIIIGGGYIAVELGHFYGAMGCEVNFLVRGELIKNEDFEVREEFSRVFCEKYHVHFGLNSKKVNFADGEFTVSLESSCGEWSEMKADSLLIATGVQPNSDDLGLENTSIETDLHGFIQVDDRLQTAVEGVYALGDVVGNYLFRHSVNFEGEYLLRTLFEEPSNDAIEYSPMPHAIFSNPQVAGVGVTEDELLNSGKIQGEDYIVGLNKYENSAMGDALLSDHGFVKLIFQKSNRKLIGAHVVGLEASDMIHMPIAYINMQATVDDMLKTIYIHPALPENIRNACRKAKAKFYI